MTNNNFNTLMDIILGIGILMGIFLGIEKGYAYFSITIISLLLSIYLKKRAKEQERQKVLKIINDKWANKHIEKRDFSEVEKFYKYNEKQDNTYFTIDDTTWRDLNMEEVFHEIDHTMSLPGMQYLYNLIRRPVYSEKILKERNKAINLYIEKDDIGRDIQYPLVKLGKDEGGDIFDYFEKGIDIDSKLLPLYTILSYLPFAVIVLFFFNRPIGFVSLISLLAINNIIYQKNKEKVYKEMEIFKYLAKLIQCAEEITKVKRDKTNIKEQEIKDILKNTKTLRKNISKINFSEESSSEMQIVLHYYNMLMLKEPKVFYKAVGQINKHREEVFTLYKLIGEIDFYIAIASYKSGLDYYTSPKLVKDKNIYINTEELYHPLLEDPVTYTFTFNNVGALVTGSNASGKSTFLRAIGINAIFSQTLYFVLAREYTSSYFKLLTSIGTMDSIVKGDSYFMTEAKSLKRIINSLEEKYPVLCILDEIFRGTNTTERISMALEVLNYMIHRNSTVIAATHDLELTNLVNDKYDNYHFRETIEDMDIKFDYQLRTGPSTTRNAIAILKYLDYPKEIYENAEINASRVDL